MPGFKVEYALSGKSRCKGCEELIDESELRVGKMVQSKTFDGEYPLWFHYSCFWKKVPKKEIKDIKLFVGVENIRWSDQEALRESVEDIVKIHGQEPDEDEEKNNKKRKVTENLFSDEKSAKKQKITENVGGGDDSEEEERKRVLQKESQMLWNIKDSLDGVTMEELKDMLKLNDQITTGTKPKLIHRCADGMLFGAIPVCPSCKNSPTTLKCVDGVKYKCRGHATAWGRCLFESKDVERNNWLIPDDVESKFLRKFKFQKQKQVKKVISKIPSSLSIPNNRIRDLECLFEGCVVALAGTLNRSHRGLKALILKHGGQYSYVVGPQVTYLVASKETFNAKEGKIKAALKYNIAILEEDFLHDCIEKKMLVDETLYLLAGTIKDLDWKPREKFSGEDEGEGPDSKIRKFLVKGTTAVDPDSKLDEIGHILIHKGAIYNIVLSNSDVIKGTNSFYLLQIIENDNKQDWHLYRKWGRVGTDIGNDMIQNFTTRDRAIHQFCLLYKQKTGNDWSDREKFEKQPGKSFPIEIDFGGNSSDIAMTKFDRNNTSLKPRVADLVELLFDIQAMQRALKELEIDTTKMPLGKLSRKNISEGYGALTAIQDELSKNNPDRTLILASNNQFYTLIPHSFNIGEKPPVIDNQRLLNKKIEMLDSLLDIEIAGKILNQVDLDSDDLLLEHYKKLNCKCNPLEKDSKIWKLIQKYITNTHASSHHWYSLELLDLFQLDRDGDSENDKFKDADNIQLLWHGSRITNFVGILSQGLRIAPPEAPVTGYMFGKGVYFADLVSKSANYCHTSPSNPIGVMLLGEVALGEMLELTAAKFVTQLPPPYMSVKGIGKSAPDPKKMKWIDSDGSVVGIPLGKIVPSGVTDTELLYNEFIVYNTQQIRMKYLLTLKFNFTKNYQK